MEKVEEHERKKYFTVDDYMLVKVLDRFNRIIGIEKID